MAKTVAALFESHTAASSAVQDPMGHGFARDTIGVMAHDNASSEGRVTTRLARLAVRQVWPREPGVARL
jgi:hypothetical protein